MKEVFSTLGSAQLQEELSMNSETIRVKNSLGIPHLNSGEYFFAVIYTINRDRKENAELIKVIQVSENNWVVIRGQENTKCRRHPRNAQVEVVISQATLESFSRLVEKKSGLCVPSGNSLTRDEGEVNFRYNSEIGRFEGWDGKRWVSFGPAEGGQGNYAFYESDARITADYSITEGRNALTTGPVEIEAGVTVTIPAGSRWSII